VWKLQKLSFLEESFFKLRTNETMKIKLKNFGDNVSAKLRPIFLVFACLPLRIGIWKKDQMFLMALNNPIVGRPSVVGSLFAFHSYFWRTLRNVWKQASTENGLQLYEKRNLAHYAQNGRGYINLDNLSKQECVEQFKKLESRLQLFLDAYPMTIAYKDGESFLDAGCGKGQNLKFIVKKYPRSSYTGFDFDKRCLRIAQVGIEESADKSLVQGSILDFDFLRSFKAKSVDHIIVCGVFSTLLASTIQMTKDIHQKIIDEFVRISKKSIIIIDEQSLNNTFALIIEQRTRATIHENIASYFTKHESIGETCILSTGNFHAAFFKLRKV